MSVTTEQARDFYRAAARFYCQAPWRLVGMDEPIRVECEHFGDGPRFVIVLGKDGKVRVLWLCDDWKTGFLIERGDYKAVADHLRLVPFTPQIIVQREGDTRFVFDDQDPAHGVRRGA